MNLLRFVLLLLMFLRLPYLFIEMRARFRGKSLQLEAGSCEYRVVRGRSKIRSVYIGVDVPDTVRFSIHLETALDRLAKAVGLTHEWQTHDDEFDRRMFILSDDQVLLRGLSANEKLRHAVTELIGPGRNGSLRCSRGCLWIKVGDTPGFKEEDEAAARIVAERVLPALTRVKAEITAIAAGPWRDDRDLGLQRQGPLLLLIFLIGIAGGIAYFPTDSLGLPRQVVVDAITTVELRYSAASILALAGLVIWRLRGTSRVHWVLLDVALVAAPGVWFLSQYLTVWHNQHFDRGLPAEDLIEVQDKHIVKGKHASYYVTFGPWPDARAQHVLQVRGSLYDAIQSPGCVRVSWHRGALGDPWISDMTPISGECSSYAVER